MKYIGSTLVEEAHEGESYGSGASAIAVQRIITVVSIGTITGSRAKSRVFFAAE